MDVLEFARELNRMCKYHGNCNICPIYEANSHCSIEYLEEMIPIVEKWSAEHPKATNLDHYAEELARIGYKVDKEQLRFTCPVHKSWCFAEGQCEDWEGGCVNCCKWWDKEYKEQKE